MSYVLDAEDLRHIKLPRRGKAARDASDFLVELQHHLEGSDLIVRLGAASDDQESVISRDPFGAWITGRYIGDVRLGDRTLRIAPRVGEDVVQGWLATVTNLVALPESSTGEHSDVFVARLLAILWCRAIEGASRHGPPSFRAERSYEGLHVRGALDVRGTAALRARGSAHLRSTARFRDLDNDVARTLVAADRTLGQHLRGVPWRTRTTEALNAQLVAAVGARPRLPSIRDLGRHRYTPITRPYRDAALLSHRIASQLGTAFQADSGACDGLLLDVAELWELFLLQATRDAFPDDIVEHGTPDGEDEQRTYLLSNPGHNRGIGRLKPDIVVRRPDGSVRAVFDAKYKPLAFRRPDRIDGVDRADLYQLASYLSRYDPGGDAVGALLYPAALLSEGQPRARAQEGSPWSIEDRWTVHFATVPVTREAASDCIRRLLTSLQAERVAGDRSDSGVGCELQRPADWTVAEHLSDDLKVDLQSPDRREVGRETNHEQRIAGAQHSSGLVPAAVVAVLQGLDLDSAPVARDQVVSASDRGSEFDSVELRSNPLADIADETVGAEQAAGTQSLACGCEGLQIFGDARHAYIVPDFAASWYPPPTSCRTSGDGFESWRLSSFLIVDLATRSFIASATATWISAGERGRPDSSRTARIAGQTQPWRLAIDLSARGSATRECPELSAFARVQV